MVFVNGLDGKLTRKDSENSGYCYRFKHTGNTRPVISTINFNKYNNTYNNKYNNLE